MCVRLYLCATLRNCCTFVHLFQCLGTYKFFVNIFITLCVLGTVRACVVFARKLESHFYVHINAKYTRENILTFLRFIWDDTERLLSAPEPIQLSGSN